MQDRDSFLIEFIGYVLFLTAVFAIVCGVVFHTAPVNAANTPEVYQIGEQTTFMIDETTITVEPGELILYN